MINKDVFGPHKMYAEFEFEPELYVQLEKEDEQIQFMEKFLEKNLNNKIAFPAWDEYYDYEDN